MQDINENNTQPDLCSICLENLNAEIITLRCNHKFHSICVIEALRRDSRCPNCRDRGYDNTPAIVHQMPIPHHDMSNLTEDITDDDDPLLNAIQVEHQVRNRINQIIRSSPPRIESMVPGFGRILYTMIEGLDNSARQKMLTLPIYKRIPMMIWRPIQDTYNSPILIKGLISTTLIYITLRLSYSIAKKTMLNGIPWVIANIKKNNSS